MSGKKILVIDDSATIRRLVDSFLSPEGYQVALAATAEDGLRLAEEIEPDLILLDHQLPGTTGFEVCRQLLELPCAVRTPVVVSSTLRKRAYVQYADLPNVVDMLPKPYTAELLKTTVANALDTAAMVVDSQQNGTAVPEVIESLSEPALSGNCRDFPLRELLDFLNNGGKQGVLEVESQFRRTRFALDGGRIAGVTAAGIDPASLAQRLPPALQSLAPVLNLTVTGRRSQELDGMIELVDRKVLDPRLLRNLLRYQAALLTLDCFLQENQQFRFQTGLGDGPLHRKLPLETSMPALLIEGALLCDAARLPPVNATVRFVRRAVRGQNLDRAGISANHMKLLNLLAEPRGLDELGQQAGLADEETRRVLYGLLLADMIEAVAALPLVVVYEGNAAAAQQLKDALEQARHRCAAKVVSDRMALRLVLKRFKPAAVVLGLDDEESVTAWREVLAVERQSLVRTKWIAAVAGDGRSPLREQWAARLKLDLAALLPRRYRADQLLELLAAPGSLPATGQAGGRESLRKERAPLPAASATPNVRSSLPTPPPTATTPQTCELARQRPSLSMETPGNNERDERCYHPKA